MEPVPEHKIEQCFEHEDAELCLPDLRNVEWQNLDYLGWVHPSGHLAYMVLVSPNTGDLRGVVLNRNRRQSRKFRLEMCSWCRHVHHLEDTAMFTVTVKGSNGRHRIGRVGCKDLDCSLRIRNLVEPESRMSETLYPEARIWRMQMSIHRWLEKAQRL